MPHTTNLCLRRASSQDAPSISWLAERCYAPWHRIMGIKPQPLDADYHQIIHQDEVWLSKAQSTPAASLVLRQELEHLLLWSITVLPSLNGRGIGNKLLDFTFERAKALELMEVRLFTHVSMERNRTWYLRRGFEEIEPPPGQLGKLVAMKCAV
ncbi:MAG: GNAT family N-acetyltransferase [Rhodobacteraceae bacterium]|nr:GNAT family N-acetyltransferase [Paracoccaceae bacterium]